MTWAAMSSPTRPAASAPASTAAFTLPTSPRTIVVTNAPPMPMVLTTSTLAALHIASVASTRPTQPLVSIMPSAVPKEPLPISAMTVSPVSLDQKARPCRPRLKGATCYLRAPSVVRSASLPPTGAAAGFFALGIMPPRSSWGRAMTCTLMTVPTRPAASAPASTAAFTAATSPRTNAVTMPLPALSQPIISTFAAFSIASVPSMRETSPLHSSRPSASLGIAGPFDAGSFARLLEQFQVRRRVEVAGVALVGVDVHLEDDFGVVADLDAVERDAARAVDAELHVVAVLDAVIRHVLGAHVGVAFGADDAAPQRDRALRPHDGRAGRALVVAADAQR